MRKVLVLNTTYEPLNVCSVRRALVLVFKQKAEVLEQSGSSYRSACAVYELPHVIRLRTYVHVPRRAASSTMSRASANVGARGFWQMICIPRRPASAHIS